MDVIFFHGAGAGAHAEDARLAADLGTRLGEGYRVACPQLPEDDDAEDGLWLAAIASAIESAAKPAVLIGHSAGGYLLLKHLAGANAPLAPAAVAAICVIAAPYPGGDPSWTFDGFDLPPDLGERLPQGVPVFLYAGEDDDIVPFAHRDLYADAIPGALTRTVTGGHQLGHDLSAVARDILALPDMSFPPGRAAPPRPAVIPQ